MSCQDAKDTPPVNSAASECTALDGLTHSSHADVSTSPEYEPAPTRQEIMKEKAVTSLGILCDSQSSVFKKRKVVAREIRQRDDD